MKSFFILVLFCLCSLVFAKSDVLELEPNQLDLLEQGEWFLEVYASWCGFCQKFSPMYETVGFQLKGRVNVAKIDGDKYQEVAVRFQVGGFPTIFYIRDGEVRLYNETRTDAALIEFANGKWRKTEPIPWYESPLGFVGKFLSFTAFYVLKAMQIYNNLNQEKEIPHAVLIIGIGFIIISLSFIMTELISFVVWGFMSMFFRNQNVVKQDVKKDVKPDTKQEKKEKKGE